MGEMILDGLLADVEAGNKFICFPAPGDKGGEVYLPAGGFFQISISAFTMGEKNVIQKDKRNDT